MVFDFTVGSPPSYWPRSPSHQCELSSSMASRSCTSSTMATFLFICLLCVLYPSIQNYHLGINDQIVALPFWHLLTASLALAETPTAGAADDLVNSSCSFTMPYVCSVGIGSHDSVEEYFHARLDILRYLMKSFNGGGRILAVQHGRVCVQASGALKNNQETKWSRLTVSIFTQGWAQVGSGHQLLLCFEEMGPAGAAARCPLLRGACARAAGATKERTGVVRGATAHR